MPADAHHLLGQDVPWFQRGDQSLFSGGEDAGRVQAVFSHKVGMGDGLTSLADRGHTGVGQNGELAGYDGVGRKFASVQVGLGDPHHIAGILNSDLQVGRAGVVVYPPVGVIAENGHQLRGLLDVVVTPLVFRLKGVQGLTEFLVGHQGGEHGHQKGCAIPVVFAHRISLHHLGVLVIGAGQHGAGRRIIYRQVVVVRTSG